MKYIVVSRENPQNRAEQKFYLQARILGTVGLQDICAEIAHSTSLTRGDVISTIMSFLDTIPKYLKMGYSVKLDELGIFRLSIKSNGSNSREEATASKVKSIRPLFTASVQLRKEIENSPVELFPEA